jgi:hypothetical protein
MTLLNPIDKTGNNQVKKARENRLLRSSGDDLEYSGSTILALSLVSTRKRSDFATTIAIRIPATVSLSGMKDCVLARAASSSAVKNRKADRMNDGLMAFRCSQ